MPSRDWQRFIANPWGAEARAAVEELAATSGDALLVGTGLTMVDLVLSLDAAGHRGEIVALSRRGLVAARPRRFRAGACRSARSAARKPRRDLALAPAPEREGRLERCRGQPSSPQPCPLAEPRREQQRRFLRHARPWWDVHRHRIAPEVAATVARMVGEERLRIMAGRVVAATETPDASRWSFAAAARIPQTMSFAYAFNCTGPLHSIERTRDPLLRSCSTRAGPAGPTRHRPGGRRSSRARDACGRWGRYQGPLLGDHRSA